MADKLLKSIKFPTLPDRYVIGDASLTEEGAAADAKAVGEALATKADTKGTYEDLIVGGAEQLMADGYETDKEPYLFRPTGGSADVGNREYLDKIVGGTVAWNQQVKHGDFDSTTDWYKGVGVDSWSASSNVLTITINGGSTLDTYKYGIYKNIDGGLDTTHKYLSVYGIKPSVATTFRLELGGGVKKGTVTLPANVWSEVSLINTPSTYNSQIYLYPYSAVFNVPAPEMTIQYRNAQLFDLTAMFGSTIADYIYSLEQANAGAGVAWFKKLFPKDYYAYDAGTLKSVEGLQSHDMVGFNVWDTSTDNIGKTIGYDGSLGNNSNFCTSDYIRVLPSTTYYFKNVAPSANALTLAQYDSDKNFIKTTSITGQSGEDTSGLVTMEGNTHYIRCQRFTNTTEVCINLNKPTGTPKNGDYVPYVKHTYALDSDLVLRGIPKLDANNNLYYDGDIYASDGTVTRKYGVVDLGTLNWYYTDAASHERFYSAIMSDAKGVTGTVVANAVCPKYQTTTNNLIYTHSADKTIAIDDNGRAQVYDSSYTDAATFKTAMSGVYLVYELATPTTETADGYEHYQICDPSGTEKFVTDSIVPVGHETRYPHDLKKKLEIAPDSPTTDGTYLMKRSGGKNTYMALPSTPSANGSYVLTVTVSGGSASYSWTAKE